MTLGVKERILLFGLLPAEGDILSIRIIRKLREELAFSEFENQALKIKKTSFSYTWDPEAEQPKEIEIGPKAFAMIAESLQRLSAAGKLTLDHMELWDRFVPEEKESDVATRLGSG